MDGRTLGLGSPHDAQSKRRPARWHGIEVRQRDERGFAVRLERIDAQIERRAGSQRRTLGGAILTECAGEMRIEPLRIVAGDPGRGILQIGSVEPRLLLSAQWGWSEPRAVGKRSDGLTAKPAFEAQHAEHERAGRLL